MAAIEASASADSSGDSHHSTEVGKATAVAAFSCSTCKLVVTIGFEIEQVSSPFVSR